MVRLVINVVWLFTLFPVVWVLRAQFNSAYVVILFLQRHNPSSTVIKITLLPIFHKGSWNSPEIQLLHRYRWSSVY